jgi:hypothetical protein
MAEFGTVEVTSTPAESSFFPNSEFRHTSKNFEAGLPKNILEKNTVL